MTDQIDILLPTYNGEKFLCEQIDSILHQTHKKWRLIIRDDVSCDGTQSLIDKYKRLYPDKVFIINNESSKKGIVGSIQDLLGSSTAPYVAFCDQDDVWCKDKLEIQIAKMKELESLHGGDFPILIHTDLVVVNNELKVLDSSFWNYLHLSPGKMKSLNRTLVHNCITGCTVMINRELIKKSLPIPDDVIMHDWWLALVAVAEGRIYSINNSTVNYRQHGGNDTGATHWNLHYITGSIFSKSRYHKAQLHKTYKQACALLSSNILSPENRLIVERYVAMYEMGWLKRRLEMVRMGFYKYGILRNLAMFVYL